MKLPIAASMVVAAATAAAQPALPPAVPAAAASAADVTPTQSRVPDARIEHLVTEDDKIRIEELRVRGQSQRIVVRPKIPGMPAYDIVPVQGSLDPLLNPSAGQRIWWSMPF